MITIQGIPGVKNKTGIRSAALYIFSNGLSKAGSFFVLLYVGHILSLKDLGVFSLFNAGILLLVPLIAMGIPQSVNTAYFQKNKLGFSNFFSSVLMIPMTATLLLMFLLFLSRGLLEQYFAFSPTLVVMMPLLAFFRFVNGLFLNMVRNVNDPVKHLSINAGRVLAEITLVVFAAGVMEWGWMGCVAGIFSGYLLLAVTAFFYFKEQHFITNSFEKKYARGELAGGVSVIIMQFGIFCTGASVIFILKGTSNNIEQVAEYSMAAGLSAAVMVLCSTMLQYTWPRLRKLLSEKTIDFAAIRSHMLFYTAVMVSGTAVIVILIPLLYTGFVKESLQGGTSYYIFICAGYFFCSLNFLLYAMLQYNKENNHLLLLSLFSVFTSIFSHTLLTERMGACGAAVSVCIVQLIAFCITAMLMRKKIIHLSTAKPITT